MNKHIMAVEDSRTQAEALRADLTGAGYEVTVARDGEEALEQLTDGDAFDLVISDIMMPGMDGYELCRRIKADRRLRDVPVILLTSLRDPVDIVRGLEVGADNFLTKPYDPDRLLSRVESVLQTRVSRDEGGSFRLGAQVRLLGHQFTVDADRQQILDLLMGSFEDLYYTNVRLREREEELVRTREQAVMASQTKSRFVARLGHELRTPLSAVIGFSQLLLNAALDDQDRRAAQQIHAGGRHLLQLIDDLVDIGRIEAAELEFDLQPVAVRTAVTEALDLVRSLADNHGVRLPDPGGLPDSRVIADPRRLRQVLINLLSNAVKYNRPAGQVAIEAGTADDHRVWLDVTDTGPGIPPDRINRLFVAFDRLGAEERDIEGTGIGLPLVRDLVEAMGGSVGVARTSPAGTTLRVLLPTADVGGTGGEHP